MENKLKGIQDLFSLLSQSTAKVNSLFSIPVLYFLVTRIVITIINLFWIATLAIDHVGQFSESCDGYSFFVIFKQFIPAAIAIGVILTAADLPVREVLISNTQLYTQILQWINVVYTFNIQ